MMKNKEGEPGIPDEAILQQIILLRGKKVMIDRDLAILYGISTKRLNEQVKRNIRRFPKDFMFQVTNEEKEAIITAFPHLSVLKYSSALPYVFTEHGAVMLAGVINSDHAITVNIQIVKLFIRMREILADQLEGKLQLLKLKARVEDHDKNIELIFRHLEELSEKPASTPPRKAIGYKDWQNYSE